MLGRAGRGGVVLPLEIERQPDDVTCGPTCLHAVYSYWGDTASLGEVVETVRTLDDDDEGRGTLGVNLGVHALGRGYGAVLYTYNLRMFDPTWFTGEVAARPALLREKLIAQGEAKGGADTKLAAATRSYVEFLDQGGVVRFEDLTSRLISGHITAGRPVLTGLSATYLHRAPREFGADDDEDDIRGFPAGHFVLLHGYDPRRREVHVADPLEDNPAFASRNYTVPMSRLVPAIMLGVLTHDANLLVIDPGERTRVARGVR